LAESGKGRKGGDSHVEERQDRRGWCGGRAHPDDPWWAALLIVLGVPAAAYLTLDPAQRRRLRRLNRKELGR
jgi:hypothetical protein